MTGDHYFTTEPAAPDQRRVVEVVLAGRPRSLVTSGGVFSPGRVDAGTAVLLRDAPDPPRHGTLLDLGCGWGPVALTLALRSPEARVHAVDVNERALDLVRENARRVGLTNIVAGQPDSVPETTSYDVIWSNPPIRVGKPALHALLETWLPRLAPRGHAYLVVQKNLGSDSLQRWLDAADGPLAGLTCDRYATRAGYRVLRVSRG